MSDQQLKEPIRSYETFPVVGTVDVDSCYVATAESSNQNVANN
jgi:hypothetical protein